MKRQAFTVLLCWSVFAAATAAGAAAQTADASPTFSKDVAPLLYRSCVTCHRSGGVAPMPLVTYQDTRPWAKAIKQQVSTRMMPPWGADMSGAPLGAHPPPARLALAVGNEGAGLSTEVRAAAAQLVAIPIAAEVESLNAAVAAGILLHALRA